MVKSYVLESFVLAVVASVIASPAFSQELVKTRSPANIPNIYTVPDGEMLPKPHCDAGTPSINLALSYIRTQGDGSLSSIAATPEDHGAYWTVRISSTGSLHPDTRALAITSCRIAP